MAHTVAFATGVARPQVFSSDRGLSVWPTMAFYLTVALAAGVLPDSAYRGVLALVALKALIMAVMLSLHVWQFDIR